MIAFKSAIHVMYVDSFIFLHCTVGLAHLNSPEPQCTLLKAYTFLTGHTANL